MPLGQASEARQVWTIGNQWFYRRLDNKEVGPFDTMTQAVTACTDHIKGNMPPELAALVEALGAALGPMIHKIGDDYWFWSKDFKSKHGPYETEAKAMEALNLMILSMGGF